VEDRRKGHLLDEHESPLMDLDDKEISFVGNWKSPENLKQGQSTISTFQRARNMIGAYLKAYSYCIELDRIEKYSGCQLNL
jgi:hypothetical protein